MPIIKWEPMFSDPFQEMEQFLERSAGMSRQGFVPAVDVYQTKDAVVVETPLAGVDPKDVDITIENDVLHIRGEMKRESEVDEKNYYRKEVRAGSFYRSVALPTKVDSDQASAESHEGMLKIIIPKAPEVKPRTVKVVAKK
ncbi:MAG: HSP20 family protein [Parcubacteria group bacterium Gr01-1014_31]|nr:MAG: HSP20 family protein [Parcubacteria group bacterium Gr01-1014_31]